VNDAAFGSTSIKLPDLHVKLALALRLHWICMVNALLLHYHCIGTVPYSRWNTGMEITLAISAFLSGAVTATFVMLVASIHTDDRHHHLTAAPDGQIEALTRTMLGVGVRTGPLGSDTDGEEN
jgi:hypothetical protein